MYGIYIYTFIYHKNRLNVRKYTIHGWYEYAYQDFRKAILTNPFLECHDPRCAKPVPRQGRCGRNSSHANGRGGVAGSISSPGALVECCFVGKWQGLEQSFNHVFFSMVHGRFIVYGVVGFEWASLHSDWQGQIGSWYHWHHTIVLHTPTRFLWKLFIYINSLKRGLQKQLWN